MIGLGILSAKTIEMELFFAFFSKKSENVERDPKGFAQN